MTMDEFNAAVRSCLQARAVHNNKPSAATLADLYMAYAIHGLAVVPLSVDAAFPAPLCSFVSIADPNGDADKDTVYYLCPADQIC